MGSPERAALIFFSIESREPRLHAGEGARATFSPKFQVTSDSILLIR